MIRRQVPRLAPAAMLSAGLLAGLVTALLPRAAQGADGTGTPRAQPQSADRIEAPPPELDGVGITEKLGDTIPLDLGFKDEAGRAVALRDFFTAARPVILTLNYSNCPMLCSLQLNGLVEGLKQLQWTAGQEFEIVTVSIDPLETPARAKLTQEKYLREYGRPAAAGGWRFLTGREDQIHALADAVGFLYRHDEASGQYIHAAGLMILSPEGKLSRYLYGIEYDPKTLRLSLVEAAEGKVGSTLDHFLLYCFHYDSSQGKYAPAAVRLMRVAGALTVLILGTVLLVFWRREARRRHAASPEAAP